VLSFARVLAANRYHAKRLIKRGGMAEVYEGQVLGEGGFERRVAIKRLLAEHVVDESFLKSFVDEARIASQLHHANIVAVLDFGFADGLPFQVLELVDGMDLASAAAAARERRSPIPTELALWIVAEIALALDYAHAARDARGQPMGIVHRDVSPENILISWSGDVKLADFGIAYAIKRLEMTRVGVVKGKPDFMAPEQRRGQDVDLRADIFALGRVLNEISASDAASQRIVTIATRPDRTQRYANAAELRAACFEAIAERQRGDTRSALGAWIRTFREKAPQNEHPLGALFDLRLSLMKPEKDGVRRFTSIARRAGFEVDNDEVPERDESTVTQQGSAMIPHGLRADRTLSVSRDPEATEPPDLAETETLQFTETSISPTAIATPRRGRTAIDSLSAERTAAGTTAVGATLIRPIVQVSPPPSLHRFAIAVLVISLVLVALALTISSSIWEADDRVVALSEPVANPTPAVVAHAVEQAPPSDGEAAEPPLQAKGEAARPLAHPPAGTSRTERPTIKQAQKLVAAALESSALDLEDLRSIEAFEGPLERMRRASSAGDAAAANASAEEIVQKIDALKIDRVVVERRLQRFARRLEASLGAVPSDRLRGLEVRYLDLLSSTRDAQNAERCRGLLKSAAALERELDRAREGQL
jgi:protein kinase-like protein